MRSQGVVGVFAKPPPMMTLAAIMPVGVYGGTN